MEKTLILQRPVIAITGSAGKSTTKEMLASILRTRWTIFKSIDNMNFFTHTKQYARKISRRHQALVLEYGMSGPGQIRRHCKTIQPNISIITNIGTAHIGNFGGDVKALARAKGEIIKYMKPTGKLILNQDDKNSAFLPTSDFRGQTMTIGIENSADYRAKHVAYRQNGMQFSVPLNGKTELFYIPIFGRHHVYNALAALAVAHQLGFTANEIRLGLRRYHRMNHRLTVYSFKNGIRFIDDSYSANPNATKAALDVLATVGEGTKIAVLGSMLALGKLTVSSHHQVGAYVAKRKIDYLYTFGTYAQHIANGAQKSGMKANRIKHFMNKAELHRALQKHLQKKCTILIKGSHGVGMKETVEFLKRQCRSLGA